MQNSTIVDKMSARHMNAGCELDNIRIKYQNRYIEMIKGLNLVDVEESDGVGKLRGDCVGFVGVVGERCCCCLGAAAAAQVDQASKVTKDLQTGCPSFLLI